MTLGLALGLADTSPKALRASLARYEKLKPHSNQLTQCKDAFYIYRPQAPDLDAFIQRKELLEKS